MRPLLASMRVYRSTGRIAPYIHQVEIPMIKCFLSHSSRDKDSYVRLVATRIRKEAKVFDEETFEAGMSPMEEIAKGLDDSMLISIQN